MYNISNFTTTKDVVKYQNKNKYKRVNDILVLRYNKILGM